MASNINTFFQQKELERKRRQREMQELAEARQQPQAIDNSPDLEPGVVESGQVSQEEFNSARNIDSPGAGQTQAVAQGAQMAGNTVGGEEGGVLSSAGQGAAIGAQLGGPKGALIGAGAGALAGVMGSRAARKRREREAKAAAFRNIATIEQQKGVNQAQILGRLMSGLGSRR